MNDLVIGSGPSGVSAAKALLERGRSITMLDAGQSLEPEYQKTREAMAATPVQDWSQQQRDIYQAPQFSTPFGQARRFGSDFAMEPASATLDADANWFGLRASRAAGGLSNLWGSAVLPYRQEDIGDWPITIDDLAPHYRAVTDFMPVSGRADALNAVFPGCTVAQQTTPGTSVQAKQMLERMNSVYPDDPHLHFGAARTAATDGCTACGMCLHGCPWGHIYSAQGTLTDLQAHPSFTYTPGAVATVFDEHSTGVTIHLDDGRTVTGDRVFVATGVLETARLVLNSKPASGGSLTLLDSQHVLLPMLHRWQVKPRPDALPLTTLPQIFLELDDAAVSDKLVHAQIYTWNEHYALDLIQNYGFGLPIVPHILRALARRLIVAQMFLHSDHSARVGLSLNPAGLLIPERHDNPQTEAVLKAAQTKLRRLMSKLGLHMLTFAARPGAVGSSFHVGGTVPMAANPIAGQSDILGRPHGLQRVHLVDASVFPSIPATTITFSAMANAHRIASLAP